MNKIYEDASGVINFNESMENTNRATKKHKWHKEIIHWANGGEIEYSQDNGYTWLLAYNPSWECINHIFRIKPQPKEPQYLYVYLDDNYEFSPIPLTGEWEYIGKIKLEDSE
jgi:hypothetical protein